VAITGDFIEVLLYMEDWREGGRCAGDAGDQHKIALMNILLRILDDPKNNTIVMRWREEGE